MATQTDRRVVIVDVVPGKGLKRVERQMKRLNKTTMGMSQSLSRLNVAFAAIGGAFSGRALFGIVDQFKEVEQRMKVFLGDGQRAEQMVDLLADAAGRTYSSFDGVATVATRLIIMGRDLKATYGDFLKVAEGLSASFVLAGATVQEAVNAARQLAQGLGSGTLQGEELRAVLEQNALVAQRLADHFGVGVGELRKMASEGKLASQEVFNALLAGSDEWIKSMENFTPSFRQSMAMIGTSFGSYLNQLNRAVGLTEKFGSMAKWVAQNWEAVGLVIGSIITALVATQIPRLFAVLARFFSPAGILAVGLTTFFVKYYEDFKAFGESLVFYWEKIMLQFEIVARKAWINIKQFFVDMNPFAYNQSADLVDPQIKKLEQDLLKVQGIIDGIYAGREGKGLKVEPPAWLKEWAGLGKDNTPKVDPKALKDWEQLRDTLDPLGASFREYAANLELMKANAPAEDQERYAKALKESLLAATGMREVLDNVDPTAPLVRQLEMLDELKTKFPELTEVVLEEMMNVNEKMDGIISGNVEKTKGLMQEVSTFVADQAGSMADAFVDFATDSEFAISDMVESMLKDLARLVIFQTITQPLANAVSGQISGMSFGRGAAIQDRGTSYEPPKALGGPVSPMRAYRVGEQGPETFIPNAAGRIMPNGAGGGTNVQVINNTNSEATTETTRQPDGSDLIRVIVGEVARDINNNGQIGQSIQSQYGSRVQSVVR